MDVNPYQALGVAPTATKAEVTAAYRTMAQIFHPDRYAEAPEAVRMEAERRMKELNRAYDFARKASPVDVRRAQDAQRRTTREARGKPSPPPNFGVPWEVAQRERAQQSARAHAQRMAREQASHNGRAVARPKPRMQHPTTLYGMGEAL
ncbi:MAG: J domain-containing protein, partial [Acidimicrobiia bacterium]